jgi:20S proteasome alpha/beta subunit
MTAIAYRDGILAADTAAWGGGNSSVIVGHRQKIVRLSDGGLFAACGCTADCIRAAQACERNALSTIEIDDNGFAAVWIKPDGSVWRLDSILYPYESAGPYDAAGASETFMLGALAAGASAEQAVRLAIKHTDGAAGDVQVERLGT